MIRCSFIACVCLLALNGCDRGVLVSEKWKWPEHQWVTSDKKSLTMVATDTTTAYQMDIVVNHEETYGYQNLYIRILTTFPSGKEVASVTSLELINADGSWSGDHGGNCCSVELPLQQRFTFPEVGAYTWTVEPYMRMDTIRGISSLQVTCRKVKE